MAWLNRLITPRLKHLLQLISVVYFFSLTADYREIYEVIMEDEKLVERKKEKYSMGVTIALLLAAATIGEYIVAMVGKNLGSVLMLVALFKAFLVVRDYMHVGRLFSGGEEH